MLDLEWYGTYGGYEVTWGGYKLTVEFADSDGSPATWEVLHLGSRVAYGHEPQEHMAIQAAEAAAEDHAAAQQPKP